MNHVRKSGEFQDVGGDDTFYDHSLWEDAKRKGDAALRKVIQEGLSGSSVTVALAAAETWNRPWVRYEIVRSFERGNGLMTLWINGQRDSEGNTASRGFDPMDCLSYQISSDGRTAKIKYYDGSSWVDYETIATQNIAPPAKKVGYAKLSSLASSYTWSSTDSVAFAKYVEAAAIAAGR